MSGFYIDVSALQAVRHAFGATESQMTAAFNKALRQTVNALYKQSVALMFRTTGAKNRQVVQGRMRRAVKKVGGSSRAAGSGKVWFGLNDMPVSTLKGSIKSPRGPRPQNRKRDALGRFLPMKGSQGATFTPSDASDLRAETFADSFVASLKGKRTIWVRNGAGHVHEARMAINNQMNDAIEKKLSEGASAMLMEYFEKDLAGRVLGGVYGSRRGIR